MPRSTQSPSPARSPWAWAAAGAGPQRWLAVGPDGAAIGVRRDRCVAMRAFRVGSKRPALQANAILAALQADVAAGWVAAGWVSYELGAATEGIPRLCLKGGVADAVWWLSSPDAVEAVPLAPLPAAAQSLSVARLFGKRGPAFCAQAAEIVRRIAHGEVYQANLTVAASMPWRGAVDAEATVAALMAAQPVPLAIAIAGQSLVGRPPLLVAAGSMERFVRANDDSVSMRPIKGTIARGQSEGADQAARETLFGLPKERAENTMIVDMARNDLQRVCHPGSVQVTALCEAVRYATLWHLESEVCGNLQTVDRAALLRATLPPASVTGCPKVAAMHVIAELEQRKRGPYCGALFIAHPDHGFDSAVAIRSLVFQGGRVQLSVGAGIVADSDPAAEWRETCLKAQSGLTTLAILRQSHGTD